MPYNLYVAKDDRAYRDYIFWPVQLWPVSISVTEGKKDHPFDMIILALLREFTTKTGMDELEKHSGFSKRMIQKILDRLLGAGLITQRHEVSAAGKSFLENGSITYTHGGYRLVTSCFGAPVILGYIDEGKLVQVHGGTHVPLLDGEERLQRVAPPSIVEVKKYLARLAVFTPDWDGGRGARYESDELPVPDNFEFESNAYEKAYFRLTYYFREEDIEVSDPLKFNGYSWINENMGFFKVGLKKVNNQ